MDDATRALAVVPGEQDTPPRNPTLPAGATDALATQIWLRSHRSPQTREAYAGDIEALVKFTSGKPFAALSLPDLQDFHENLIARSEAPATIARRLYAVKSLLTFCQKAGHIPYNVGAALKPDAVPERLAERIMSQSAVLTMIALEKDPRNHAMLRLLYYGGMRVSELCALRWRDVQPNEAGGQVCVFGKGQKERYILLPGEVYEEVAALRSAGLAADSVAPVFPGEEAGKGLSRSQVFRIVSEAAIRAGIATYTATIKRGKRAGEVVTRSRVSPHWLRHAHGSHALKRNAPVPLVRDTLGHSNIATTNKYAHAEPGESSGSYLPM